MAKIEDLVDEIADPELRDRIAREVKDLKETKRFGLVFEEHIPETVSLHGLPIRPGLIVQNRTTPGDLTEYQVLSVENGKAIVVPKGAEEPETSVDVDDLLVVKRFHETIYPGLTPVGETRRAPDDKPAHVVISGENFHALQLLTYAYAGKVDCIYIDPPYNTGDKSWKYNNRFVDENDSYRHSKWLSFMEKRLRLSRSLLKPDGVLIVTIDEHEVHHLGVLMRETFHDAYHQTVTIVITARGVAKQGLARVEEYALYNYFGRASASPTSDDFLTRESDAKKKRSPWASLLRRGTNATPADRPGLVYPIYIADGHITGSGRTLLDMVEAGDLVRDELMEFEPPDRGPTVAWPTRSDGSLGTWQVKPETLDELRELGFVKLGRFDDQRQAWAVNYLKSGPRKQVKEGKLKVVGREYPDGPAVLEYVDPDGDRRIAKTVWRRTAHDAGTYGSALLQDFLGARIFDFPKSLYAVRDSLATVILDNPDALVVDFFAGSGTTLHAVALLNAKDEGRRRCILVTNNELTDRDARSLYRSGTYRGDTAYEARGIFEAVTKPRCEAAITGVRSDGKRVQGEYLSPYLEDHAYADGLDENACFYRLDYLDPDSVELGRQFNAIAPMLWMAAGSVGSPEEWDGQAPWSIPDSSTYAVLFDEEKVNEFCEAVAESGVTHVWLVTNSHSAFTEMRQLLPDDLVEVRQLYADYLRNFTLHSGLLRP